MHLTIRGNLPSLALVGCALLSAIAALEQVAHVEAKINQENEAHFLARQKRRAQDGHLFAAEAEAEAGSEPLRYPREAAEATTTDKIDRNLRQRQHNDHRRRRAIRAQHSGRLPGTNYDAHDHADDENERSHNDRFGPRRDNNNYAAKDNEIDGANDEADSSLSSGNISAAQKNSPAASAKRAREDDKQAEGDDEEAGDNKETNPLIESANSAPLAQSGDKQVEADESGHLASAKQGDRLEWSWAPSNEAGELSVGGAAGEQAGKKWSQDGNIRRAQEAHSSGPSKQTEGKVDPIAATPAPSPTAPLPPSPGELDTNSAGHCKPLDCSALSPPSQQNRTQLVCASNGRLFRSVCEMHKFSCRNNVNLFKQNSILSCPNAFRWRLWWLQHQKQRLTKMLQAQMRLQEAACTREAFREFQVELLREFGGDVESLFSYLDQDSDGRVEARELWPRRASQSAPLSARYALGADFAFEPHFDSNPCSLSHLILFASKKSDNQGLNLSTLARELGVALATSRGDKATSRGEASNIGLKLGQSRTLACPPSPGDYDECQWRRNGFDLSSIIGGSDPHLELMTGEKRAGAKLQVKQAQLYLSGQYQCTCTVPAQDQESQPKLSSHTFNVQVYAEPRVVVKPAFQWSLPSSRILFECHHDYIDTTLMRPNSSTSESDERDDDESDKEPGQLGASKVSWLKDNKELIVASDQYTKDNSSQWAGNNISPISARASITMTSSRLALEELRPNDTGEYNCQVEVPLVSDGTKVVARNSPASGSLLVREPSVQQPLEQPKITQSGANQLWMFHEKGISVYRLQNDDGQEMELVKELAGNSAISPEVDGNWNQLTLCGGLNQEQVVICEWSDNALYLDLASEPAQSGPQFQGRGARKRKEARKYIYVGQPNLNRVIVLEGGNNVENLLQIVAIVQTEPQPRRLFPFKPNKLHLSKWLRRRLSPSTTARLLATSSSAEKGKRTASGAYHHHRRQFSAHPLELTPKSSRLYSMQRHHLTAAMEAMAALGEGAERPDPLLHSSSGRPSLIQRDVWLLCHGQPSVVDLEEAEEEASEEKDVAGRRASEESGSLGPQQAFTPMISRTPFVWPSAWRRAAREEGQHDQAAAIEATKFRNRKSMQIIQSTFLPYNSDTVDRATVHHRHEEHEVDGNESSSLGASGVAASHNGRGPTGRHHHHRRRHRRHQDHPHAASNLTTLTPVGQFNRATVVTTHRVSAKAPLDRELAVKDLVVPPEPHPLRDNLEFQQHYAYVTHYNEKSRIRRISMDSYRYDRIIELRNMTEDDKDCDPQSMIVAAQGLLVVQCVSSASDGDSIGQLVLDELTASKLEFNPNIKAQESYLSPDHRYLVSVYTNLTTTKSEDARNESRRTRSSEPPTTRQHSNSIIYVQLVSVHGLRLQYEIKTTLEIGQCSFVWRDGYYAAIFVSTNRRDQQSEVLSLRLADSRLELMARVPGLISASRHKEPLEILHELQLASLSTNQGIYIVDLEDNRVTQTLSSHQHHLSTPTLLWVEP